MFENILNLRNIFFDFFFLFVSLLDDGFKLLVMFFQFGGFLLAFILTFLMLLGSVEPARFRFKFSYNQMSFKEFRFSRASLTDTIEVAYSLSLSIHSPASNTQRLLPLAALNH